MRRGYFEREIDTYVAGFVLGPCINATGRLESAGLSVRLLLAPAEDIQTRADLADKLAALNEERKALTAEGVDRAFAAFSQEGALDKVLVLSDTETHESVAGIVAGRVKDVFNRPAIVLTRTAAPETEGAWGGGNTETEYYKGSGRSIDGYNMFEALYRHRGLLLRFGGHAMAAGLTISQENIPLLRECLNRDCALAEDDFHAKITADGQLRAGEVTLALSGELARLAPFGKGNREPLFVTYGLQPESLRVIDEKNTIIFTFPCENGKRLKGIAFGLNEKFMEELRPFDEKDRLTIRAGAPKQAGLKMDAVYGIETNLYNGAQSVQMRIRDFVLYR
jgi:single-stranded-DNA-specific exonuclease